MKEPTRQKVTASGLPLYALVAYDGQFLCHARTRQIAIQRMKNEYANHGAIFLRRLFRKETDTEDQTY